MTFVAANGGSRSPIRNSQFAIASVLVALVLVTGCSRGPRIIPAELRKPIDRSLVEFPSGMRFERFVEGLRAPSAIAFDTQKNLLLVAELGTDGAEPRILAFNFADGSTSTVYPQVKPGEVPDDKIVILEDADGDGKAYKSRVYAGGLLIPTGVEV